MVAVTDEVARAVDLLTGGRLIAVVATYAVCPYLVLWLAVRLWPKGHPRRAEYLAEYDVVPWYSRPLWVADVAIRSLLDGTAARHRTRRSRVPKSRARKRQQVLVAFTAASLANAVTLLVLTAKERDRPFLSYVLLTSVVVLMSFLLLALVIRSLLLRRGSELERS